MCRIGAGLASRCLREWHVRAGEPWRPARAHRKAERGRRSVESRKRPPGGQVSGEGPVRRTISRDRLADARQPDATSAPDWAPAPTPGRHQQRRRDTRDGSAKGVLSRSGGATVVAPLRARRSAAVRARGARPARGGPARGPSTAARGARPARGGPARGPSTAARRARRAASAPCAAGAPLGGTSRRFD